MYYGTTELQNSNGLLTEARFSGRRRARPVRVDALVI
jgi:hypothetical protein